MSIGSMMLQMNNKRVLPTGWSGTTTGLQLNLLSAPTSGTTWTDASGNGRNATLQGSPSYVATNGGGIRLNNLNYGGTDYISAPYNIASNTVTVEIVASFNPTTYWATIWANEVYSGGRGYFAYVGSSTGLNYGIPGASSNEAFTSSNSIRHLMFVINGNQYSFYVNNTQVGTTDTLGSQTSFATNDFYFGARHSNAGTGSQDKMNNSNPNFYPIFYQMRVYNIALNSTQRTANYDAVKTTYGI